MESSLSVLSQYAALLPVDGRSIALPLVLLLAYRCGAHSSLATWAAVSNLPAAPLPETPEDAKRLKKQRIRRGALTALALIALYTSEIGVILTSDSEEAANTFFKILVATFMTFAYFSTFAYAFSLPRAVWNHESGRLILRPYCATRSSKLRAAAILLLSIALATATVLLPSNAILHVVGTGALTFSMVSKPASRVTGVRKLTIFFCAYEAAVLALTVAMVWMAPPNEKPTSLIGENSSKTNDEVSPEELAGMMPSGMMIFLSHIIPAFYAAPVGYYIAACLRYDWHASQQSVESASVLSLEQLPARTGCACARKSSSTNDSGRPSTSSGLRIPSASVLTASVPSVYFTTTLIVASILLCTISPLLNYSFKTYVFPAVDMTIQGMDQAKLALAKQYYETQTFGMFGMFLTIPVMCIAVAIQAASSGDRKALWSYKEVWHGKGAGKQPIALGNISDAEQGKDAANVWEKPTIVVEDVDANEETPLITLEEAIKS